MTPTPKKKKSGKKKVKGGRSVEKKKKVEEDNYDDVFVKPSVLDRYRMQVRGSARSEARSSQRERWC